MIQDRIARARAWIAEGPPWRRLAALGVVMAFGWLVSIPIRTGDDTRNFAQRAQGAAVRAGELVDSANAAAAAAQQKAVDLQRRFDEITATLAAGRASPEQVAALKRELVEVRTKLTEVTATAGKPGPPGPAGPRGAPGATGAPAPTPTPTAPPAATTTSSRPSTTTTTSRGRPSTTTTTRPCVLKIPGVAGVGC